MNSDPTAYSPGAGSLKPSRSAFLAKKACGICTRMPAPSPARGSAPTAPRCSRLHRIASASSTIWCDLRPLISAMKPTPQAILVQRRIVKTLRCHTSPARGRSTAGAERRAVGWGMLTLDPATAQPLTPPSPRMRGKGARRACRSLLSRADVPPRSCAPRVPRRCSALVLGDYAMPQHRRSPIIWISCPQRQRASRKLGQQCCPS